MSKRPKYQLAKATAVNARKAGVSALQQASEALVGVVAMYRDAILCDDKYLKIQGAQGLERLAARYDALDMGSADTVTVVFRGGVPSLGEAEEDAEADTTARAV